MRQTLRVWHARDYSKTAYKKLCRVNAIRPAAQSWAKLKFEFTWHRK